MHTYIIYIHTHNRSRRWHIFSMLRQNQHLFQLRALAPEIRALLPSDRFIKGVAGNTGFNTQFIQPLLPRPHCLGPLNSPSLRVSVNKVTRTNTLRACEGIRALKAQSSSAYTGTLIVSAPVDKVEGQWRLCSPMTMMRREKMKQASPKTLVFFFLLHSVCTFVLYCIKPMF